MRSTSTPGWRRSKAKKRKVSAKSTAQSIPSAQAIQLAARVLLSPTPRPCPFAPSVTTPHYSTTVSQALRQPLRSRRSRANFRECPERELRFNGVLRSSHQTWSSGIMLVVEGVVPPQRRTWGLGALTRKGGHVMDARTGADTFTTRTGAVALPLSIIVFVVSTA